MNLFQEHVALTSKTKKREEESYNILGTAPDTFHKIMTINSNIPNWCQVKILGCFTQQHLHCRDGRQQVERMVQCRSTWRCLIVTGKKYQSNWPTMQGLLASPASDPLQEQQ